MTQVARARIKPEHMAAIEEIKQLKARYCYCVDHKDWDGLGSLFTLDARIDESAFAIARHPVTNERLPVAAFSFEYLEAMSASYEWPLIGPEAMRAFGRSFGDNMTVHHLFVPEIELTSETTAKAVWPMEDYAWWPEGSPVRYQHGMGYYRETYECLEDERWYIKTIDFSRSWIDWR